MKKKCVSPLLLLYFLAFSLSAQDIPFSPDDIDIPYKAYVLDNGLRLIVHEDHKAPIAAVNVWYHVGSKDEKEGKSGFAHLFEHLMFNGSENFNDDYFQALERIGGTDLNGTTNTDRTNYFQNVPVTALDQVLWLESDRMGHLLGAIDQEKLDEQRGVVQNEKRQGENQPYGRQYDLITKTLWPEGHPYSWTVIGDMEDLDAASLEDVQEWFKTYYGPANAVVVVAGDVNPEEVHAKVRHYFGNISSGPTLAAQEVNIPRRFKESRQQYQDRVPEARIVQTWIMPEWGSEEASYLNLASDVLAAGKTSRLYKKLVYEDQTASYVYCYINPMELAGTFTIMANVKPGGTVEEVEQTINEVVAEFLENGPTEEEMQRVKSQHFANFIKGLERIGGFGGKSDILAQNAVYGDDPEYYKKTLKTISSATKEDILQTAQEWISEGKHTLICTPFPEYTVTGEEADRSSLPAMAEAKPVEFPDVQTATLKNGMKVMLAQRSGVPTLNFNLVIDAGYAADQFAKPGVASLAMNMMDEGTKNMDALEISEKMQMLGASINAGSDLDASYVGMSTLKQTLGESLELYSDIILNPAFPEEDFQRLKNQQIAGIQREKSQPVSMALRVMPKFLYGEDHAYSLPLTGSGDVETVEGFTRNDMIKFYDTWIKPNNSTMVVVGDISMQELTSQLEEKFAGWKKGEVPEKNIAKVNSGKSNVLYLMDRPESQQSVIIGGYLTEPYGDVDEIARQSMIKVFGGEFTSRLNMNLREDKHWSYGAMSLVWDAKGQRPLLAYAPVQTDKTKESLQEIIKEFQQVTGDKPITKEEFEKTKNNTILQLPGRWETNGSVAGSLNEMVKYGLDEDYYKNFDASVRNLSLEDVQSLTKKMLKPDQLQWFVVGDKEKIMKGLQEIGFDEVVEIDADGNPLQTANVKLDTGN
ncbi:M16 family metallopeptidase [Catalinimonas niigatensis]|uniref:M16 family metallopeptidase n=1 Tax=Catalinimonas niigatensis TaxID=1397264 RepID=UPI0026654B9D|nr:pitrilysin family protein [Catalinimonas niigatensis]WPP49047.1 pitrilysin family protein [Catalinimonas niigatensis]